MDLIERADAIKVTWQEPSYTDAINALTEVRERIKNIPSAEKYGEWIDQDHGAFYPRECSRCHKEPLLDAYGEYVFSDFCPNCGKKMIDKDIDVPYKIASDQRDYDNIYESTYNEQNGSM